MACPAPQTSEPYSFCLHVVPDPLSVRAALEEFDQWLGGHNVDADGRGTTQIVLAEILNNIVEHGQLSSHQGISTSISLISDGVFCKVKDEAPTFRALETPAVNADGMCGASIQLAEGGYGVFLVQSLARNIRYCEVERGNHLEFVIPLVSKFEQIY